MSDSCHSHGYEPIGQFSAEEEKKMMGLTTKKKKKNKTMMGKIREEKSLTSVSSQIVPCLFAVFINLLDAVTFGTCFFPAVLGQTESLGIALFLFSTLVVQVVFIAFSSFQYGMGTSMAENIPFVHTMTMGVYDSLVDTHSVKEMIPTVLTTVCLSTIINGLSFYLVGILKLGHILHYFPRHVILGMTFGFGMFLLSTCFQVTTGIAVDYNIVGTIIHLDYSCLLQLGLVTTVEIFLRLLSYYRIGGEMAGPLIMVVIPIGFYVFLLATNTSFEEAREANWLFPKATNSEWYDMWLPFFSKMEVNSGNGNDEYKMGFALIEWGVVFQQFPIIFSLMAFTLLLVPVRIPSLSMLTGEDVDFDEELIAQGLGNIVSGVFGSVHNYLSYSNSVFFYHVGGWGKISQTVIAISTLLLFIVGPQIINFVPRIIAGIIMFHLGADVVNDAIVASRPALDSLEYMSVLVVGAVVVFFGFVTGIIAGGVSACVTFVVQSSKNSSVRGVFTGEVVRSNTAWTGKHRHKLEKGLAKKGIYVIQLQGHIFFGNIQQVIRSIEDIIIDAYEKSVSQEDSSATTTANKSSNSYDGAKAEGYRVDTDEVISYDALPSNLEGNQNKSYYQTGIEFGEMEDNRKNSSIVGDDSSRFPEFVVLDCSFVTGFDANATFGLFKLRNRLANMELRSDILCPIRLFFAGVQEGMQEMFTVHMNQESSGHESNAEEELLRLRSHSDASAELSFEMDDCSSPLLMHNDERGDAMQEETKIHKLSSAATSSSHEKEYSSSPCEHHDDHEASSEDSKSTSKLKKGFLSFLPSFAKKSASDAQKKKSSDKKSSARKKRSPPPPDAHFHLDVNTALQTVEEHIISGVKSPTKDMQQSEMFSPLQTQDSFMEEVFDSSQELSPSEEALKLPSDLEMVTPLQPQQFHTSYTVGSPPSDSMGIPLIASGGMAALSKSASAQGAPVLTSPRKSSTATADKKTTAATNEQSFARQFAGRIRRWSISAAFATPDESAFFPDQEDLSVSTKTSDDSKLLEGHPQDTTVRKKSGSVGSSHDLSEGSTKGSVDISGLQKALLRENAPASSTQTVAQSLEQTGHGNTPLRQHIPPAPPVSQTELSIKKPVLTDEEFKQKKIIRKMVYELDINWREEDFPAIKRLSWYLLKDVLHVVKGQALWTANEEARAMGLVISGRLEAVITKVSSSPSGPVESSRTLQVIMPGTLIGELGFLAGVNHSRTIIAAKTSVVALLSSHSLQEIEKYDLGLLCLLQRIALKTAAARSHELMLFSAGAIGPN